MLIKSMNLFSEISKSNFFAQFEISLGINQVSCLCSNSIQCDLSSFLFASSCPSTSKALTPSMWGFRLATVVSLLVPVKTETFSVEIGSSSGLVWADSRPKSRPNCVDAKTCFSVASVVCLWTSAVDFSTPTSRSVCVVSPSLFSCWC